MHFEIKTCHIRPGYTDLRKGIHGLMHTVMGQMDLDTQGGDLFIFCGRNRRVIKMLYWGGDGFWLLTKRLHSTTFAWPVSQLEALEITERELSMLLEGIDLWRSHPILLAERQLSSA